MSLLADPARLAALQQCSIVHAPPEDAFDRLTRLVTRVLHVPVALVSLVAEDHQFFKSCIGLPEPWASQRRTPLTHSFCQHVVTSRAQLVVPDARQHLLVKDNAAITDLSVIAYAGVPLVTPEGFVLGSFCAIDIKPREWTDEELGILHDLAATVMDLMTADRKARAAEQAREYLESKVARERRRCDRVLRRFRASCPPRDPHRDGSPA